VLIVAMPVIAKPVSPGAVGAARAPKSRAGCHFAAAIGLRAKLGGYVPTL
jgi:hypothetical protein